MKSEKKDEHDRKGRGGRGLASTEDNVDASTQGRGLYYEKQRKTNHGSQLQQWQHNNR